jgi:putative endonuclease
VKRSLIARRQILEGITHPQEGVIPSAIMLPNPRRLQCVGRQLSRGISPVGQAVHRAIGAWTTRIGLDQLRSPMALWRQFFVYIISSRSKALYIGVTNNLERRVQEHKSGVTPGFAARYHIASLIYFEEFQDVRDAIAREKQLKAWRREKKVKLIETMNPEWRDLAETPK